MDALRVILFISLYFLVVHGKNNCHPSFCKSKYLPIRFPFRLPDQSQDCGYPGFDISCDSSGRPVINLTNSGSFSVIDIDYKRQKIDLYDPYSCLESRFLKLNLSSSPFNAVYYGNYSTCPLYMLEWDTPYCTLCEAKGLICEFKDSTSKEIRCFTDRAQAMARLKAIIICIILALMCLASCIICFKCLRNQPHDIPTTTLTARGSHVAPGLDDSTIESFATVILGESRRITGPNGTTCPICLSDYLPKDLLRCIPECQHCFHANCIDEWLRLKSICPVCRNSPS